MPTYGMEDLPEFGPCFDTDETPDAPRGILEGDDMDRIYSSALNVRDECGMDLSDAAVIRLVNTALREYRR